MAITTYSELQTALENFAHTDDLTERLPEFIALCEADMQGRLKLLEFETSANIAVTDGVGVLPTGYLAMRSVYWDDDTDNALQYVTPEAFDAMRNNADGPPVFYTVSGGSLYVSPTDSGTAVTTHNARFTPLSDSSTTNAILTNWPNAYLYGSLLHLAIYTDDDASMQKYGTLFNSYVERINQNNEDRRFAGPLTVRAR